MLKRSYILYGASFIILFATYLAASLISDPHITYLPVLLPVPALASSVIGLYYGIKNIITNQLSIKGVGAIILNLSFAILLFLFMFIMLAYATAQ